MSNAWSIYVITLTTIMIVGCVWLLWYTSRPSGGHPDETTGHVWDGDIREYNKPLPRWWLNLFYITIVFSIGYLIWYPGLGNFAGIGGWTSAKQHDAARDGGVAPDLEQPLVAEQQVGHHRGEVLECTGHAELHAR